MGKRVGGVERMKGDRHISRKLKGNVLSSGIRLCTRDDGTHS